MIFGFSFVLFPLALLTACEGALAQCGHLALSFGWRSGFLSLPPWSAPWFGGGGWGRSRGPGFVEVAQCGQLALSFGLSFSFVLFPLALLTACEGALAECGQLALSFGWRSGFLSLPPWSVGGGCGWSRGPGFVEVAQCGQLALIFGFSSVLVSLALLAGCEDALAECGHLALSFGWRSGFLSLTSWSSAWFGGGGWGRCRGPGFVEVAQCGQLALIFGGEGGLGGFGLGVGGGFGGGCGRGCCFGFAFFAEALAVCGACDQGPVHYFFFVSLLGSAFRTFGILVSSHAGVAGPAGGTPHFVAVGALCSDNLELSFSLGVVAEFFLERVFMVAPASIQSVFDTAAFLIVFFLVCWRKVSRSGFAHILVVGCYCFVLGGETL